MLALDLIWCIYSSLLLVLLFSYYSLCIVYTMTVCGRTISTGSLFYLCGLNNWFWTGAASFWETLSDLFGGRNSVWNGKYINILWTLDYIYEEFANIVPSWNDSRSSSEFDHMIPISSTFSNNSWIFSHVKIKTYNSISFSCTSSKIHGHPLLVDFEDLGVFLLSIIQNPNLSHEPHNCSSHFWGIGGSKPELEVWIEDEL